MRTPLLRAWFTWIVVVSLGAGSVGLRPTAPASDHSEAPSLCGGCRCDSHSRVAVSPCDHDEDGADHETNSRTPCCPKGCKSCPSTCCGPQPPAIASFGVVYSIKDRVVPSRIFHDFRPTSLSLSGVFHPPRC